LAQWLELAGSPERRAIRADRKDRIRRQSAATWRVGGECRVHCPRCRAGAPFIPAKLRSDLGRHQLEAVFTADIHRHQRVIDLPSATVEVAFDQGFLKSGNRSMPVSEIELELKDGNAGAIYELAERLAEHGPVRPSIRSKAARGFDLAADTPPPARKPQKLRLDPSIPLDDAFATILRSRRAKDRPTTPTSNY
jgi:triphosphatase